MGTQADSDSILVDDLVDANHILYGEGVLDGFGHVSVRSDSDPASFFIARSMAPALVGVGDILRVDLDGQVIGQSGMQTYVERFIHTEIYRSRPDVKAIVHSHSPTLIPFGATGTRLRPVCHTCGFLGGGGCPVFEMRDVAGDGSDLLVSNPILGQGLVSSLGSSAIVLMRGHGSTVVGESLRQAVHRAVYAETNARLQLQGMALGEVRYLTDDEARASDATTSSHLDRAWVLWRRKARRLVKELELQDGR